MYLLSRWTIDAPPPCSRFYSQSIPIQSSSRGYLSTDAVPDLGFLQLLNLAIFTTLSLFNLLAVPAPHLLSLFLARQPSPHWKSQIAHLDMHHLVFGINFQIHSVSLSILVSIHLLIHFSTHLCHHPHSHHPSLFHSFTPGSKPTFSTNPSHRRFLLPTGLPHDNGTGPDLSRSPFYF